MIKETIKLKSCTKTLGKPFDDSREAKCPAYEKINKLLLADGWENKVYTPQKTAVGDRRYLKYATTKPAKNNGGQDIMYVVEANIEGTDSAHGNKCRLTLSVESYLPENRLAPIGHESEKDILDDLRSLFIEPPGKD